MASTAKVSPQQIVKNLLDKTRLSGSQLQERLDLARDPDYWRTLNPHLSIAGIPKAGGSFRKSHASELGRTGKSFDFAFFEKLNQAFKKTGHYKLDEALSENRVHPLRAGIENLVKTGWPTTFAFVYDEYWEIAQEPVIKQLVSTLIGPGYKQSGTIWAHYVKPRRGSTGWQPHVDGLGYEKRITLWVALSEATPENGCMVVVPKDLIDVAIIKKIVDLETLQLDEVHKLLQSSLSLPVKAGSLLGWDFQLLHWGSSCHIEGEARISLSLEFIAADQPPQFWELPLYGAEEIPTFEQRLEGVGKALVAYDLKEPVVQIYKPLAERLWSK